VVSHSSRWQNQGRLSTTPINFMEKNSKLSKMLGELTVYRLFLGSSILAMMVSVTMNCTRNNSKVDNHGIILGDSIVSDTCNACPIDSFSLKLGSGYRGNKISIDRPVAIQFFNQVRFADKYDNDKSYDTLMTMFNMKHTGDRNMIYGLRRSILLLHQGNQACVGKKFYPDC
jgi:hypothetical protein